MKHTLFIFALITASIQTFAQSPRIKLNQITKDSLAGSVLISSATDSGMVYSRDLFISYGADTVLILGGDTLAATSGIISSVLSDGVTITGDGTLGSELTVDTATVIATKGDLTDYVTIAGMQTITGAKTFSTGIVVNEDGNNVDTRFEGYTDANLLFLDASANRVGIGTSSPSAKLDVVGDMNVNGDLTLTAGFFEPIILRRNIGLNGFSVQMPLKLKNNAGNYVTYAAIRGVIRDTTTSSEDGDIQFHTMLNGSQNQVFEIRNNGNVGIDLLNIASVPTEKLDVNGNGRFRSIGSGASAGALHRTSNGTLTTNTSDLRLKTNINPLENTLEKLLNVNTYTFNWINESDRVDLGMIAQEVEEIFPRLVFTNPVDGYKGIHYDKFSSILTKAIQEQQSIIESIQTELDANSSIIESQSNEIETLKTLITDLSNRLQILENN